jgi:hypothetical protein
MAGLKVADIVDGLALDQPFRARAFNVHLAHRRQVSHAHIVAGINVFVLVGGVDGRRT